MKRIQRLVFISIYVALALVLDYIKSFIPFLNMPSGGSINIALIPVVICSFHLETANGIYCGLLWWLISSLLGLNPYYISIGQYIIDYVLPSGIIGISSLFFNNNKTYEIELGIFLMMFVRTLLLIVSGAIFWPDGVASGSTAAWFASCAYNLPYCIATLIMLMIIIPIVLHSLKKYFY